MNKRSISFQKAIPTCGIYLIIIENMVVGSIHINDHNTITNIDINRDECGARFEIAGDD